MTNRRVVVIIEALLAVIMWGGSFVATKVALREAQPFTVIWLRFGMGVLILGVTVWRRKQWALPARRELLVFAGLGLMGITFHQWLQSTALLTARATTTAWIVTTSPVFIAILGLFLLRERLRLLQALGIVLATAGVWLVVSNGDLPSMLGGQAWTVGDFMILVSAVNWAVFSVLSRGLLHHHPAARMMLYVMGFGWLFCTLIFLLGGTMSDIPRLTLQGWVGILFLGIFCSGLAYIFWYDALQLLPASQAGVFLYFEPLVTLVVAAVVLNEAVVWTSIVGGAVILLGVWMVNRKPVPSTGS